MKIVPLNYLQSKNYFSTGKQKNKNKTFFFFDDLLETKMQRKKRRQLFRSYLCHLLRNWMIAAAAAAAEAAAAEPPLYSGPRINLCCLAILFFQPLNDLMHLVVKLNECKLCCEPQSSRIQHFSL